MPTRAEVVRLLKRVEGEVAEAGRYCFMSRGIEFQQECRDRLVALKTEVVGVKDACVQESLEDEANMCLSAESLLNCSTLELQMWIQLKEDDPGSAWDSLVGSQVALQAAVSAHRVAEDYARYAHHLGQLEATLFPGQTFMSPGMVLSATTCSICDSNYDDCEHIAGRPYMGRFCTRTLIPASVEEVSVVTDPKDKRARVIAFSDGNVRRDVMTWRETD